MTARTFIRSRAERHVPSAEIADALRTALERDGIVELHDEVGGSTAPAFTLHTRDHGVIAWAPDGRHLGTFADALIGVQHAFTLLDRVASEQPAPRIRGRRSTRGTAAGEHR